MKHLRLRHAEALDINECNVLDIVLKLCFVYENVPSAHRPSQIFCVRPSQFYCVQRSQFYCVINWSFDAEVLSCAPPDGGRRFGTVSACSSWNGDAHFTALKAGRQASTLGLPSPWSATGTSAAQALRQRRNKDGKESLCPPSRLRGRWA